MADDFDPYYTWLGIPPEEQPADHYRLLGVRRYESNADVITNAMDQRMHYLRSLQVGKRSALSQKILNEVSSAGVVLLDSKRRAEYDHQLKAKESKAAASVAAAAPLPAPAAGGAASVAAKPARPLPMASSLPKAAPLSAPSPGNGPMAAAPGDVVVKTAPAGRAGRHQARASIWKSPVVIGGAAFAAVAIVGLVGVIVVRSLGAKPDVVDNKQNTTVTDKGGGRNIKPHDNQGKGTVTDKGNGKTTIADSGKSAAASAPAWTTDGDSQRLFVLEFDQRASVEIGQTAPWVSLEQNATIEGWFKLNLDRPQGMTLFGTRRSGTAGSPPQGWMLMARRVAENGKMVDQWVLEAWKSGGQFVQVKSLLEHPTSWHHVALVSSAGKEWLLYVDGKQALRYTPDPGLSRSGADLRLGDDASGRGSGFNGRVCGLRISDAVRYTKAFAPPSPLEMTHDEPTAVSLHFAMAVPNAAAGTIRRSSPQWQYGHGRYDDGTQKVVDFAAMLEWNGLQWKPGPGLPRSVAEWMSLDPLGGHTGNGQQHAVIRRWIAPAEGALAITGTLTHAHETKFGDGVHARIVSSASGQAGQWDSRFSAVPTPVEKLAVKKGDFVDFVVECKNDNHCDKFAWQAQLTLASDDGKPLGTWDSEKDFHGPNRAGAVYQLASLGSARWQRLDPSASISLTQLAPIPSSLAPAAGTPGRIDIIQTSFDGYQHMRGAVTRDGSALRTKENDPTAFMIPVAFPEEYTLEAEVVRESGDDSICIGFPVPGARRMTAIVDGQKGTRSGLAAVNDKQIFTKDNPLVRSGKLLTNGKAALIRIQVRKSAVELLVDGSSIARWNVNPSDKVLLAKGMGFTNPKAMAIFTWNSPFRINRLELIPQTGSESPAPPSQSGRIELVQKFAEKIELVRGELTYSTATGWTNGGKSSAFMIPEPIGNEYVLEAEVTRQDGNASISFHLPVRGMPLSAIIDIYDARLTGLSDINDWNIQSAGNTAVHRGPVLTNGRPAQVRIVVSQQEISLSVDGKKLSSWAYDPGARLNAFQGLRLPDPKKLGVTTGNSTFHIKRLELIPGPTAAPPPALAAGSPIEMIDGSRRTIRPLGGSFQISGNTLTTGTNRTRIAIDAVELPDEYVLEGEITRISGGETIGFGLTVQGRPVSILLDGWNSTRSGICLVPGQDASMPGGSTIRQGPLLTKDKPAKVRIVVNRQEVALEVDGQPTASWQNDPQAQLRPYRDYEPDGNKLTICSWFGSSFKVARLQLLPGGKPTSTGDSAVNLVDAARRTVRGIRGSHQVAGGVLTTSESFSRVAIEHDLPDEYTLEGEMTRVSGDDTLGIGFPVQGRPLSVLIDGWHSVRSGICIVPGQDAGAPTGPTMRDGPLLTTGEPARFRLVVSKQEVRLEIDDKTMRWPNDLSAQLQSFKDYEPDGNKLTIASWSSYRIANLKLISAGASSPLPVPPATGFAGAKKNPIPDDAAKAKANSQIGAVFGDELKGAKTPPAKAAVAKKINDLAKETKDLPTKYVMLEEAKRLFVEVKDVGLAMQTADAISQDFDVPLLPAKVKLLEAIGEGTLSGPQRAEIVSEACSLGYEAIDTDQFEVAQAMATVVRTVAARATAADVKAEAKEFVDEVAQRQKRFDAVRRAEQTLAAMPDDPAANLALGLYHLFDRGDQAKGLAMLAKGSDAKLAAAAKARQESVSKGLGGSLPEADAWFDSIATVPADYKPAVQKRALEAYELAIASAEGLDKARAEKRRDQLKADLASAPSTSAPAGSKRGPRIRRSDLPESAPGMIGRVYLGGKDAGLLVTYDPQRTMDTQTLRDILAQAKAPGGRIVLESVLTCPTPMSMYVSHRGASTAATQQLLVNGKVLSTVGGSRGQYDSERLQLVAGSHLIQWVVEFDGSTAPSIHIYEDGNGRGVPLNFNRDQSYGARKLTTSRELDLTN